HGRHRPAHPGPAVLGRAPGSGPGRRRLPLGGPRDGGDRRRPGRRPADRRLAAPAGRAGRPRPLRPGSGALAMVALAGLAEGPAFAATFATRQRWSPPSLRGQIFTTAASLKLGAFAVG